MRDFAREITERVAFIRNLVVQSGVRGIVFAHSGGKDATLTGILCKQAVADTVGLILPCGVARNYEMDRADALTVCAQYNIESREVDLQPMRDALLEALAKAGVNGAFTTEALLAGGANISIAPRLRMTAVYAVANAENRLVAGTGNFSERHMGYFTKWGDGAFDFNPIADLTVTEIFDFLRYLKAPSSIIDKAPSAGLFEGQTDEGEMGISYQALDTFLLTGQASAEDRAVIDRFHAAGAHKRVPPVLYGITQ